MCMHKIRIQILCYFLAKEVYQFCSTVLAACRIGDFLFRVFEASEGKREAGVEHETRPTGDNFLRAFPRRVSRAPLPLHASLPLPENAKRIACFLYQKHGGRPQQAL